MKLIIVLLIFLLLFIKPIEAMPIWSQRQESIPSGSQYSPISNYNFQIDWDCDENHTIANVLFESNFSTLNETLENITVYNISANTFQINFTSLPAKNFVYRWHASDNESNLNYTSQITYVINKNTSLSINLYLNRTETNRSYSLNSIANFTVFLNILNKTVYLNSSYPNFDLQSGSSVIYNLTNLSFPGSFSLTAYWEGDENYSASNKTYYFDNLPPQYSNAAKYPTDPLEYYPSTAYSFGITWSDVTLSTVLFESNFSGSLRNYTSNTTPSIQNVSNSFNIVFIGLPAGNFFYRWIANDSLNKVNDTNQSFYYVVKRGPLSFEIIPSRTVINGTTTTAICQSNTGEITAYNFKLYRNSTLIANDSLLSRRDNQTLAIGIYEYVCNSTETQNFTNQSIRAILNVTLNVTQPPPVIGTINLTGPSFIEVNLGESAVKNFYLENNLGQTLYNLSVTLTGISSSWYDIIDLPTSIPDDFSLTIGINFAIPIDANEGSYILTLKAEGKNSSGVTQLVTKSITLSVTSPPPQQNFPPVYSGNSINKTFAGYEFSLKWNDDTGLSGYIFSSNITGDWLNDSWTPFSGTESWSHVYKNISLTANATIAWKAYANDSNNLWSESEEFYLKIEEEKTDMTLSIIIVSVFVIVLAIVLLIFNQKRAKTKTPKKEETIYVYRKEDL